MTSRNFSMPIDKDIAYANAPRGGGKVRNANYQPLPKGKKATGKFGNKLYFSLFNPAAWSLYHRLDGHDQKGLLHDGCLPAEIWTYYWKMLGHYIADPADANNVVFVICPQKTNEFVEKSLGYKAVFVDQRCAFCEETATWSGHFGDWWESHAVYQGKKAPDRWGLDTKLYTAIVRDNPVLGQIRDEKDRWKAQTKFLFTVFDICKLYGERPLDEGENTLSYQLWPGPKGVFDGLLPLFQGGVQFWDCVNPCLMVVTKDCEHGGSFAKYSVQNMGPFQWADNVRAYIEDDANLPKMTAGYLGESPFGLVLSYDEMRAMLPAQPTQIPGATAPMAPQYPVGFGVPQAPGLPVPPQAQVPGPYYQQPPTQQYQAPAGVPGIMPIPAPVQAPPLPAPAVMPTAVAMPQPQPVPTPQAAPAQRRGANSW